MKAKGEALDDIHYKEYFGLTLRFNPNENGLAKRLSSPAYVSVKWGVDLYKIVRCVGNINAPFQLAKLSKKRNQELLSDVVLEVLGITLKDYQNGGSFNYLGLDIGKHYIDHCANRFEDFFQLAYALRMTYENVEEICKKQILPERENQKTMFIGRVLTGESLEASIRAMGYKDIEKNLATYKETYEALLSGFKAYYESVATLTVMNKHCVISQIIREAKLPDRFDTFEFVRSMLIAENINNWSKPSSAIFLEYVTSLKSDADVGQENTFSLTLTEFLAVCRKAIKDQEISVPSCSEDISVFIKHAFDRAKFVESSLVGVDKLKRLCFDIEAAGGTLFVALSGWRKSEFGFPMTSVSGSINIEILDNLYTPWRFDVNWTVEKTHGEAKVLREITSYAYYITYMTSVLNLSGESAPALYRPGIRTAEEKKFQSGVFMEPRINALWTDFIRNYKLFNESEVSKYSGLSEIRSLLREALPIYEFCRIKNKTRALNQYRDDRLDELTSRLFDNCLSPETRVWLKDKNNSITIGTVRAVTTELLAELPYPTPHAFRHIWAEAVLIRYRGDVGKVIRANFRHMDSSFFMAYLRNKETQVIVKLAERTVINKIVRQYFQSAGQEYHDYAGGFRRYIGKVVGMTKVFKPEDQLALMDKVSGQIISIKSNLWATCILRDRQKHLAKCATDGVPQRRNADPKFCLGCIHADITEMNYEGIVLSIKDDVAACRNTELPGFFKADSEKTVQLALKRIKELKKNSGKTKYDKYIAHLEESLEMALWEPLKWSGS
jgi:hypothetical protein